MNAIARAGLSAIALLTCALGAPCAASAAPAQPTIIPLEPYLGVLWSFEARIGGKPQRLLLDTAGGLSVVTPEATARAGCRPWGQVTGFRMRGQRLDSKRCDNVRFSVEGREFASPTAAVIDMSTFLPKDAPPLAGVAALDAFAGRQVTLDLSRRQLIIETPRSFGARIRGAHEAPVRFSREAAGAALTAFVGVDTAEGRAWLELDSGSDGAVIVGRHVAEALGVDPQAKTDRPFKLQVAGEAPAVATAARAEDLIIDGNIGDAVLSKWVVTLDLAAQKLWIAPAQP